MHQLFLTLIALTGTGLLSACQSDASARLPAPREEKRLLIIDMTNHPGLVRSYRAYGAEKGYIQGQWAFDKDGGGHLDDRDRFAQAFARLVPRGFGGIVALDWEGTMTTWLKRPPDSAEFRRAMRNLRELLLLAKEVRPNAMIGYYGIPVPAYHNRDAAWRARCLAMVELLALADWVGPYAYHPFRTHESARITPARQRGYAVENMEIALEVARRAGGKPVYAFVTHRYSPGNRRYGRQRVTDEEFQGNLRGMLSARVSGRGIDGIIWWGADDHYAKTGQLPIGDRTRESRDRIHDHYFRLINGVVREHQP